MPLHEKLAEDEEEGDGQQPRGPSRPTLTIRYNDHVHAKVRMNVVVQNVPDDIPSSFQRSMESIGIAVEWDTPPPAPIQMAGPAGSVVVTIDPETLKLIFEYAMTVLAAHAGSTYVRAFFKSAMEKAGETTGAAVVRGLRQLWKNVNDEVWSGRLNGRDSRIYATFQVNVLGSQITIDNAIFASHIETFSADDHAQAFDLVMFRVIPIAYAFASACRSNGVLLETCSASLEYSLTPNAWIWRLRILPIGVFTLTSSGRLMPNSKLEVHRFRPLMYFRHRRRGIGDHEIAKFVRAYAQSLRRT